MIASGCETKHVSSSASMRRNASGRKTISKSNAMYAFFLSLISHLINKECIPLLEQMDAMNPSIYTLKRRKPALVTKFINHFGRLIPYKTKKTGWRTAPLCQFICN